MVEGDSIIGEICHIRAVSPNGPRHELHQSSADRHGYDNLILLCANHHKVVDDDPEAFTVERLVKMKVHHASRAAVLPAGEVAHGARLLIDQSVASVNQVGGITAHTVNQTFNVHAAGTHTDRAARHTSIEIRARGALTGRAAENIDHAVMLQRESYPQESVTFGRFG
jgi:hypothetical protein